MKQRNQFIPGITIFLVMLMGGGWITYQLLIDEPTSKTTKMTTAQRTSQNTLSHARAVPSRSVAVTTTSSTTTKTKPEAARTHPAEKTPVESGSSLAHASTVPVAKLAATKVSATTSDGQVAKEQVVTLADLQFGLSRSGLGAQAKKTLDGYADTLGDPQWSVLIQGHTDETGSIRQNLHVGLRRANTVKQYLMAQGIPGHRLHVVSLGEYQPACTDMTPACQLQNRRVSFSVAQREHVEMPPALPVTLKKTPPAEHTVVAVEHVSLPEMNPEPLTSADLTDVQADLKQSDTGIRVDTNTTQAKMDPIYPGPVHSTPPPAATSNGHNH
jgi:peptidoglycan-associated lipoprotein